MRRISDHDAADGAIRDLLGKDRLFTSAVTYGEVLTGTRLDRHGERQVRGFFTDLVSEILSIDAEVADKAADLRSKRKSLRMPDALILATAVLHPEVDLIARESLWQVVCEQERERTVCARAEPQPASFPGHSPGIGID